MGVAAHKGLGSLSALVTDGTHETDVTYDASHISPMSPIGPIRNQRRERTPTSSCHYVHRFSVPGAHGVLGGPARFCLTDCLRTGNRVA